MSKHTIINLPMFSDDRGTLTVMESLLPFQAVRSYWIYGADGKTRGGHRHIRTRQALVAISGEVSVYMNDGTSEETVQLNRPNMCLLVEPKDWHTMTFGKNSILLVMSSHPYDKTDYIDTLYESSN